MGELTSQPAVSADDGTIQQRLAKMGLKLPTAPTPLGYYDRGVVFRDVGFLSGQLPLRDGRLAFAGRVGAELNEAQAQAAARLAALNTLAQIRALLGSFTRFERLIRVDGYVAGADGRLDAPRVLDAASALFLDVLGERGRHARSAFVVARLPLDAPIELVVVFGARPDKPAGGSGL
jgi:enamine deaminase RidA (YjgF/YER057c/UK114 family)